MIKSNLRYPNKCSVKEVGVENSHAVALQPRCAALIPAARFHIDKLRALGSWSRDPTQGVRGWAPQAGW